MIKFDQNFWTGFAVGVPTGIALDETARFIYRKLGDKKDEKKEEKKDDKKVEASSATSTNRFMAA